MKKLFALLAFAGFISACNDNTPTKESTAPTGDSTAVMPAAPDTAAAAPAPMKDSVMQYKDGKVMVMTGGSWSALSKTVTTTNGRKVSPNGEVSKNGKTRKMEDGMMIDKDGQMMDKDGKAMDNTGWE